MKRKGERREKGEKPDGKWCACTPQGHRAQTSRYVALQPLEKASGTQCLERDRATDAPNQAAQFSNKKNGCRIQPFFTLLARQVDVLPVNQGKSASSNESALRSGGGGRRSLALR